MQYVMLTLGHNSSAAVVTENGKIRAYEQERFDRVKSSSAFPADALRQLVKDGHVNSTAETEVYVSHWFDIFDQCVLDDCKYFDYTALNGLLENYKILTVSKRITHHDAHAYSVLEFAKGQNFFDRANGTHILVADGFGNQQEVISVYEIDRHFKPKLVNRVYGYEYSLGLMYQYATSFCGMSENKDEYKFLGYETYIGEYLPDNELEKYKSDLDRRAAKIFATLLRHNKQRTNLPENMDGTSCFELINYKYLQKTKKQWHSIFSKWLDELECGAFIEKNEDAKRAVIGFGVQRVIEKVCQKFVKHYDITNLLTCGGIFYNVKLNNVLLNSIPGFYCTHPINGDQGCGIGLLKAYEPFMKFDFCDMVCGSTPDITDAAKLVTKHNLPKNVFFGTQDEMKPVIAELLKHDKIVNVKRPGQEFGPRALCHTTTLAQPTKQNAMAINVMNNRNEVMPMAPVVTRDFLINNYVTSEWSWVIGSDKYMVITYHVDQMADNDALDIAGVIHADPLKKSLFTSRPQVTSDRFMVDILKQQPQEALINTSFNYHGEPIILTVENALSTFKKQCEIAKEKGIELPYLCIVTN